MRSTGSKLQEACCPNPVVFPPRTGWDGFIWVYLSSILLSRLIRKNKVQPAQQRAAGVRPRPLTSTGCCFWISSWWGGCLRARWWCHKAAFSAPKRDVTHKLVNLQTSASIFDLDFRIIRFLSNKKKKTYLQGFGCEVEVQDAIRGLAQELHELLCQQAQRGVVAGLLWWGFGCCGGKKERMKSKFKCCRLVLQGYSRSAGRSCFSKTTMLLCIEADVCPEPHNSTL